MPGAVGRTSTYALCNATLPYVLLLANEGLVTAAQGNHAIQTAVNVFQGELIEPAVAKTFDLPCSPNPFL
jgi:alanine dehydrogenase